MTETAEASVYGVVASWLTPSCLFIFINLVIGTIAITSRFANTTKKTQHQLVRSPSLLQRLASLNLSYHKHEPTTTTITTTIHKAVDPVKYLDLSKLDQVDSSSLLDRVKSLNLCEIEELTEIKGPDTVQIPDSPRLDRVPSTSMLDRVRSFNLGFNKAKIEGSDPVQPQLNRAPSILQRLKSSLSFDRSSVSAKEAEPESEAEVSSDGELVEEREEEGVDAKADEFINRFRQQLRLQRLDSIIRYRDMMLKRN